jgi:hypothetical protein
MEDGSEEDSSSDDDFTSQEQQSEAAASSAPLWGTRGVTPTASGMARDPSNSGHISAADGLLHKANLPAHAEAHESGQQARPEGGRTRAADSAEDGTGQEQLLPRQMVFR